MSNIYTWSDELNQLANPMPIFEDPEYNDDTGAKLADVGVDGDDDNESHSTTLRRKNAELLAHEDVKYAGKTVSRRSLHGTDQEQSYGSEDSSDEVSGGESENEDVHDIDSEASESSSGENEIDVDKFQHTDSESSWKKMSQIAGVLQDDNFENDARSAGSDDESDDEEQSGVDDESMSEDNSDADGSDEGENEEGGIKSFSKKVGLEAERGADTRNQLSIWDALLKGRIDMQKVLSEVNQLPQPAICSHFLTQGGKAYQDTVKLAQHALNKLLDELVALQTGLLQRNPDTAHVLGQTAGGQEAAAPADDEEIPSDSDVEEEKDKVPEISRKTGQLKRKLNMSAYPDFLAKRHSAFAPFRNSTIQKWHDKTRVASGKLAKGFSAFDQSTLKQVEQILADRPRLVERTRLKRTAYRVLGHRESESVHQPAATAQPAGGETLPVTELQPLHDYDTEIFDDGDFYHQLLRELIQRKTSGLSDPVALSRQWLELQKLRSRVKRRIDTRASKGRKIRFTVHPKLVNFMAPRDTCTWTDEARNDLYSSLFGGKSIDLSSAPPSSGSTVAT